MPKVAVTDLAASIVTVQVSVFGTGVHAVDHPTKTDPLPGVAVSVTVVVAA